MKQSTQIQSRVVNLKSRNDIRKAATVVYVKDTYTK